MLYSAATPGRIGNIHTCSLAEKAHIIFSGSMKFTQTYSFKKKKNLCILFIDNMTMKNICVSIIYQWLNTGQKKFVFSPGISSRQLSLDLIYLSLTIPVSINLTLTVNFHVLKKQYYIKLIQNESK